MIVDIQNQFTFMGLRPKCVNYVHFRSHLNPVATLSEVVIIGFTLVCKYRESGAVIERGFKNR